MVGFSFGNLVKDIGHVVKGAAGLMQGVVSLVPGIGTGISAAIGAGMSLLEGGSPLEVAVNAAFGAIPIPPGVRQVAQGALDAVLHLVRSKNLGDAAVAAVRQQIPAGLPQQVFDTLAHLVLSHHRQRATTAIVVHAPKAPTRTVPLTRAAHFINLHRVAPTPIAPLPVITPLRMLPSRVRQRGAWVFA